MDSLTSSTVTGAFVGRLIVLIPQLDFGLIEQVTEGALTRKGDPASTQMEALAISRAREVCREQKLEDYVILTDSQGAVVLSDVRETEWLAPGRLHYASLFLDRILNRGRYLRSSSRKVIARKAPNKLQQEVYDMFQARRLEFKLSKSMLWNKIQMEMNAVAERSSS